MMTLHENTDCPPSSVSVTRQRFTREVIAGLGAERKTLSPKWLYDRAGSALFDSICELPEYYVTRAELSIVERKRGEIAATWGPRVRVVEPGAGSGTKTRLFLGELGAARCSSYVPMDIAREHLAMTAVRMRSELPWLHIVPICADFTLELPLPPSDDNARNVVYFPGSTIGNFEPPEAEQLLTHFRVAAGMGGLIVLGIDLRKEPSRIHAAYNDAAGVTAAFNKNVLVRMNRELHGNIDVDSFSHYAFYEPRKGCIEMHLVSRKRQTISVAGRSFSFAEGESIRTECSYKYDLPSAERLAHKAGLTLVDAWIDDERTFAVLELQAA
ncbi:MAG: L-histidine N(alpha)-methyltransferase [Polyangiaceae bacterium]|nr:L-histidine N(alpha)-methyltransferase [Polyangiaceae bacterium]